MPSDFSVHHARLERQEIPETIGFVTTNVRCKIIQCIAFGVLLLNLKNKKKGGVWNKPTIRKTRLHRSGEQRWRINCRDWLCQVQWSISTWKAEANYRIQFRGVCWLNLSHSSLFVSSSCSPMSSYVESSINQESNSSMASDGIICEYPGT